MHRYSHTLQQSTHLLKDNSSEKKQNCYHTVVTIWKCMVFFPHRFVFVVVKTSALERSLFLLLVLERVDVGTPAVLFARFVTISWWTWFTSTKMEASSAADTTLRCLSPAVLLVMRWENLMSMLLFDRLCCFLVVRTAAITKWRTAVVQMIEKTLNSTPPHQPYICSFSPTTTRNILNFQRDLLTAPNPYSRSKRQQSTCPIW